MEFDPSAYFRYQVSRGDEKQLKAAFELSNAKIVNILNILSETKTNSSASISASSTLTESSSGFGYLPGLTRKDGNSSTPFWKLKNKSQSTEKSANQLNSLAAQLAGVGPNSSTSAERRELLRKSKSEVITEEGSFLLGGPNDSCSSASDLFLFGDPNFNLGAIGIPQEIWLLLQAIDSKAATSVGIFRKPAATKSIRSLKNDINEAFQKNIEEAQLRATFETTNVHALVGTLKDFLKNQNQPLLQHYQDWLRISSLTDTATKLAHLTTLINNKLSTVNRQLLAAIVTIVNKVCQAKEVTNMTPSSCAISLTPSLIWSDSNCPNEDIRNVGNFIQIIEETIIFSMQLFSSHDLYLIHNKLVGRGVNSNNSRPPPEEARTLSSNTDSSMKKLSSYDSAEDVLSINSSGVDSGLSTASIGNSKKGYCSIGDHTKSSSSDSLDCIDRTESLTTDSYFNRTCPTVNPNYVQFGGGTGTLKRTREPEHGSLPRNVPGVHGGQMMIRDFHHSLPQDPAALMKLRGNLASQTTIRTSYLGPLRDTDNGKEYRQRHSQLQHTTSNSSTCSSSNTNFEPTTSAHRLGDLQLNQYNPVRPHGDMHKSNSMAHIPIDPNIYNKSRNSHSNRSPPSQRMYANLQTRPIVGAGLESLSMEESFV